MSPIRETTPRIARVLLSMLLALPLVTGCYTSTMTTTSQLVPGVETVLTITDQGRIALAPSVGPGLLRVNGLLAERTDTTLTLEVASVEYLGGSISPWQGQPLTLSTSHVGAVVERRFSKGRTWATALAAAGAFATLLVSLDLAGGTGGNGPDGGSPPITP